MSLTGIDDTLKLEAVYFSAPVPRDSAILTVLGAVFDRVYFPGVYLPKEGFDTADLDREIARVEAIGLAQVLDEVAVLVRTLKFTKYAKILDGFCDFGAHPPDSAPPPSGLVKAFFEVCYGPSGFGGCLPLFDTNRYTQNILGTDVSIIFPGSHYYLAGAVIHSAKSGIPLVNDIGELPIPGLNDIAPMDSAKVLAGILAIECTRLALPPTPLLYPEEIMEFREQNKHLLRAFRRSMLRYAADLNGKIKDFSPRDFESTTKFFVETQIVPSMDELNAAMNDPARPWYKRALDTLKIIPEIGGAFLTGGSAAALTKAISASAAQFFVEVGAMGDKQDALKRSGLTYLLHLRTFHDNRRS
jgi:hypothetical protein